MIKTYDRIGETLHSFTHKSGLRVYVLPKKGYGKSYAMMAADFGSINNIFTAEGETVKVADGVAHFLEHKLFEEEEGNVFEKFSAFGASANAFTSFDLTSYLFSATSNVYESLDVLIRFVQNPYFTDENVEKEKGIIGQEIDMYRDDPNWNCFFGMLSAMYKTHPIRIDIAGSVESVGTISKELLYKCYRAFYAPRNMLIFIAGDVDPEEVHKVVDGAAADVPSPTVSFSLPEEPEDVVCARSEKAFMVAKPMFAIGFKEKPIKDAVYADCIYDVIGRVLFGKSTALYKALYDESLVGDSFDYEYSAGKGYAFMSVSGESDDPDKVRNMVLAHIEKVRREGITEEDFERAKRCTFGSVIRALDDVEEIAHGFVTTAFRGGDYLTRADAVRALTREDAEKILREGFAAEKCVLSVIVPKERG